MEDWKDKIDAFLSKELNLELHPDKSKIISLSRGVSFLWFRIFYHFRLVRKRNLVKIIRKLHLLLKSYHLNLTDTEEILDVLYGWNAYACQANTYHLRQKLSSQVENSFVTPTSY